MDFLRWCRIQWDRALAVSLFLVGALALVLGWIGVSQALYPAEQMPFVVSGGIGGLFLLGLGGTFWLSAELRDEWRKLDRIEEALTRDRTGDAPAVAVDAPSTETPRDNESVDRTEPNPQGELVTLTTTIASPTTNGQLPVGRARDGRRVPLQRPAT